MVLSCPPSQTSNLYPTYAEKVSVHLSLAAGFSKTDPAYNSNAGWNVLARPSGVLTNLSDGRAYPYLFWEGNPAHFNYDMSQCFVVPGAQTKAFLQKQLAAMGLNQDETSVFIAFWLPKMQDNPYNLIHFAGKAYTKVARLSVSAAAKAGAGERAIVSGVSPPGFYGS